MAIEAELGNKGKQSVHRGGITKTGNSHARRALVEGAWAYRMKARVGHHKVDRLCGRYRGLRARGKIANVVNIAIAREMVGFIWSIDCTVQSAAKTA